MTSNSLLKTIRVPASTTNLGSGFDVLGLAVKLYLTVEICAADRRTTELRLGGEGATELPADTSNLIYRVMQRAFELQGQEAPAVTMTVSNQIPVTRGLGSSAAAIVSGIGCFEALTGAELSPEQFFRCAFEFEHHPDNLTAARFGGFTVSCVDAGERVTYFRSDISPQMKILVVVPEFQLQTEKARSVIPRSLSLEDAVFNLQRSSLTVAALLRSEFHLLRESMRDSIHQPFRAPLIPGFAEILRLQQVEVPGLLGICLSGAGPSVLVFAESHLQEIYRLIQSIFQRHRIPSRAFELEVDNQGRTIN